jgi:hypothetical protein
VGKRAQEASNLDASPEFVGIGEGPPPRGRPLTLENHFDALLRREKISFSHPCRTEGKETADFMIRGCDEYQDKKFPEIGCGWSRASPRRESDGRRS